MAASQSGTSGDDGSGTQGPIMCTRLPQSPGYANGVPLATKSTGALRKKSSNDRTGRTPRSERIALMARTAGLSSGAFTTERITAARIRPATPGRGRRPSPKGGTPGTRKAGVNGEKQARPIPPASDADSAPQQFTSTSTASGRTSSTAIV